jgi:arabidopsis histidine kinase 2/3/4 (cytokinin receptor)
VFYFSNLIAQFLVRNEFNTSLLTQFTEEGHIFVSVHLLEEIKNLRDASTMFDVPHEINNKNEISSYATISGSQVVDRQRIIDKFKIHDSSKDSGHRVNLFATVIDTGVGIPEEAQSRIFTPFMQADSSTSRTYGGTGIGLSISKRLVELMGGEIGFVSKSGIGSIFSFTADFEEGRQISGDVKRYYAVPHPSEFQGMRALVVDGRGTRAEITKYHLQRLGVHVNVATNPKSALSALLESCSLRY